MEIPGFNGFFSLLFGLVNEIRGFDEFLSFVGCIWVQAFMRLLILREHGFHEFVGTKFWNFGEDESFSGRFCSLFNPVISGPRIFQVDFISCLSSGSSNSSHLNGVATTNIFLLISRFNIFLIRKCLSFVLIKHEILKSGLFGKCVSWNCEFKAWVEARLNSTSPPQLCKPFYLLGFTHPRDLPSNCILLWTISIASEFL